MSDVTVYIGKISIRGLYDKYNFEWKLNRNVNILVGINGSGKTTLFNIVDYLFTGNLKKLKQYNINHVSVYFNEELHFGPISYSIGEKNTAYNILPIKNKYSKINTFDVPSNARGKDKTLLPS